MINRAPSAHAPDGLPAHHPRANGIYVVRLQFVNFGKLNTVFVAERQVGEQVFESVNPALRQEFRALRTHALDHAHFSIQAVGHLVVYLYHSHSKRRVLRNLRPGTAYHYSEQCTFPKEANLSADRLTSSDKRALLLWVLAGVVGVAFAHHYFFRAFPEASVNFKISRADAL
jgi:hypothetical protein